MKKYVFLTIIAMAVLFAGCESKKSARYSDLPQQSQTFLEMHFGNIAVRAVIKEKDDLTTTWKVYLENGWELDFLKNGEWDEVDCKFSPVPASVLALIPESIVNYSVTNFPATAIVEINKENYGYEIGLSNDLDLKFNAQGKFLKID